MAETTHTSNLQLKLIGSGREAGTWGDSTNENLVRLESALTRTVSLDVTAMPIGSTSAASNGSTPATWITVNASDSASAEAGSEGRAQMVEFKGTVTGNITVNVRGADSGTVPARVFFVKNSLTAPYTLTLDGNGTDYTIQNGKTAVVAIVPTLTGGFAAGVHNPLSDPQVNSLAVASGQKINFLGAGEIDFDGAGTITLPAATSSALSITNGSTTLVGIDSSSTFTLDINTATIDTATQDTTVRIRDARTNSLKISDGTIDHLAINTSTEKTTIGSTTLEIDSATISTTANPVAFTVVDNNANALTFNCTGVPSLLNFNTTNTTESIASGVRFTAPDLRLTGTDAYINFDTTDGSGGYGIRDNAGTPEVKKSGGAWAQIAQGKIALAIANATASEVAGMNKLGAIDVGPIRIIFNTVTLASGEDTITLGTGGGTTADMATTLYTVFACQATADDSETRNVQAWVLNGTGAGTKTFKLRCRTGVKVTYFAIGDAPA